MCPTNREKPKPHGVWFMLTTAWTCWQILEVAPPKSVEMEKFLKITLPLKKRKEKQHAAEGDYSEKDVLRFSMRYVCLSAVGYFIAFLPSSEADGSQACNLNQ